MQRLRSTWLALMGGALLVTLSVSAAFGAPPTGEDAPRGQTVAGFVHELVFGEETDETADETEDETDETLVEDETDESDTEVVDSGAVLTDPDEEGDVEALLLEEREVPEEFANHGECVSTATQDEEGFEASEAENKGEWVSEHARFTCWGLEVPTEDEVEESSLEDEADTAELTAKEERKAEQAAARAEREADRASAKAARTNRGNAAGRGGGRP